MDPPPREVSESGGIRGLVGRFWICSGFWFCGAGVKLILRLTPWQFGGVEDMEAARSRDSGENLVWGTPQLDPVRGLRRNDESWHSGFLI